MTRFIPAVLALLALVYTPCSAQSQAAKSPLKNEDVMDLLDAGLTPEIVIAKINSTPCRFDTSPNALKRLKAAHVPDSVILAMVKALPTIDEPVQTGYAKCNAGATEVSVWLAPGKLTVVSSASCGERLDILQDGELWMKVRTRDGKVGYVSRQAITLREPVFLPPPRVKEREDDEPEPIPGGAAENLGRGLKLMTS